jgi:hypothetical protein
MDPGGSATDQVFARLEQLRKVWPKKGWSWDYRFNCVASSFHVDLTRECERAILSVLPEEYSQRTISKAPEHIQDLGEEVGGVRSDQRIFTMTSTARLVPYAMWWPWGDEITISLRVGLAGYVGESDHQRMQVEFQAIS